jgi:REP element-mobilizing transposase RayT
MKGIKGASARRINELRGTSRQSVWQDESWDRIVRDDVEFWQKLEYMHWNPVKAGLVKADEVYPFWFLNRDFL